MAIHRTKSGRWQADWVANGKRLRGRFDTKKEADRALTEIRHQIHRGVYKAPKSIPTFSQIAEEWFSTKTDHRVSSQAAWRTHIDRHLIPRIGTLRLDRINVAEIEKCRDGIRKAGLGVKTVNKVLTTATAIFKMAIRRGYTLANPAALAERLRAIEGEIKNESAALMDEGPVRQDQILSPAEVKRLLNAAEGGLVRTLLMTAVLTGMRHSEMLALRWSDLDLESGKISVRRSLSRARVSTDKTPVKVRFFPPKTRAGTRTLPIPLVLIDALTQWRDLCPKGDADLVFPGDDGRPAHRSATLRMGLYPTLEQAGLRRVGMHSLRHFYASGLIAIGASLPEIAYLLGHSSPQTTLKIYAHHFTNVSTDSVDRLVAAIGGSVEKEGTAIATATSTNLDGSLDQLEATVDWHVTKVTPSAADALANIAQVNL